MCWAATSRNTGAHEPGRHRACADRAAGPHAAAGALRASRGCRRPHRLRRFGAAMPARSHAASRAGHAAGRHGVAGHAQWPEHLASATGCAARRLVRQPGQPAVQRRADALCAGTQRLQIGDCQPGMGRRRTRGDCHAGEAGGAAGVQRRLRRGAGPAARQRHGNA